MSFLRFAAAVAELQQHKKRTKASGGAKKTQRRKVTMAIQASADADRASMGSILSEYG